MITFIFLTVLVIIAMTLFYQTMRDIIPTIRMMKTKKYMKYTCGDCCNGVKHTHGS